MQPSELPLRDIHLPDPVSWWPPAPGWWLLTGLLAMLVAGVWLWRRRRHAPLGARPAARAELARIEQHWRADGDGTRLLREVSMLLRRVAITRLPRDRAAGLHGDPWLRLLDELLGEPAFSGGPGRVLAAGPYQPAPRGAVEAEQILTLCRRLIERLPQRSPRP